MVPIKKYHARSRRPSASLPPTVPRVRQGKRAGVIEGDDSFIYRNNISYCIIYFFNTILYYIILFGHEMVGYTVA